MSLSPNQMDQINSVVVQMGKDGKSFTSVHVANALKAGEETWVKNRLVAAHLRNNALGVLTGEGMDYTATPSEIELLDGNTVQALVYHPSDETLSEAEVQSLRSNAITPSQFDDIHGIVEDEEDEDFL